MLNSDPVSSDAEVLKPEDAATVDAILRSGAIGAIALAGLATAIVVLIWFAFYFLVFVPRAGAP
jgi:hypothetical protein